MADDVTDAYMAGIIDGEGCINVRHRKLPSGRYFVGDCSLTINNTSEELIEWINFNYGGTIVEGKNYLNGARWKRNWICAFYGTDVEHVLERVYPYLVVKKRQAEIALELRSLMGRRGERPTEENHARRLELFEENKLLNQKGR